jgi:hypothetical protein
MIGIGVYRGVMLWLAVAIAFMLAWGSASALATTQRSDQVAIILGGGTESAGTLQTSGSVAGSEQDSFEGFHFTYLTQEEISPSTLSQYDTVVLNQVFTSSLSESQEQILSGFVTSGGKLIIHDADGTDGNSYSWLPVPAESGTSCENCGHTDGEAKIIENNTIVSNEPSSPYYIDVDEFPGNSDAVGDANVLFSNDPRWYRDIEATNDQNVKGAVDAYAEDGGLILYDGFDTDDIESTFESGNAWLQKIWYDELNEQWNPANLPDSTPLVGASGHCGYDSITVGVAVVCAEHISASPTEATASGNVVLDGGVAVGNGPVTIDQETKEISVAAPAPISLLRPEGPVALGSAEFTIEAGGTTDPISGKANVAKISLTGASLGPLGSLRVGDVPFSLPGGASLTLYLDSEMGGGLIGAGSLELPMLGKLETSGSLSLGVYAKSPHPVIALGGAVHVGAIPLAPSWQFEGLELTYQEPSDTWTASGGLEAPIGSLHAEGSLVNGQLNSLQVNLAGQNVPLGDSGFFFSEFGGGFTGLVNGPLSIDASTGGYWGVPDAPVEPFYLDNVTLTVNFAGSVSLNGAVSLALKDHSPLHGEVHLKLTVHPFSATGSFSTEGQLPGVSLRAAGGAGFTPKHFTAAEAGTLKVFGLSGNGETIVSDKGLGASGRLCAFHICQSMALAGSWDQIGKLDVPAIIGGEPRKLITVSGVAASGQSAAIHVPAGRALLLIAVSDSAGAPTVTLRAPDGKRYPSTRPKHGLVFTAQPEFGLTTIAVLHPHAGTWHIASEPGEQSVLKISAQTVGSLSLITASKVFPTSSSRHPLAAHRNILLRWTSAHLPRGVRVTIIRRSNPHEVGTGIAADLGASGHYSLPVSKLPLGRSYLSLAATLNGVPFQQINVPGQIWRATPHKTKHH